MIGPDGPLEAPVSMAYCSTSLVYPEYLRDATTKQFLPRPKRDPAERAQAALDAGIAEWEASEEYRGFRATLAGVALPKITKIVAFANSTLSMGGEFRTCSTQQHALMLTLRDVIVASRRSNNAQGQAPGPDEKIQCFAQDPMYSDADKEVLLKAGIAVLDDPRGFLEVDDDTAVLCFSPNIPVRQIVADIARPAVLIWGHVNSEAEMLAEWEERFPGKDRAGMFCSL